MIDRLEKELPSLTLNLAFLLFYTIFIFSLGVFLPVIQNYYLKDYFRYIIYFIFILFSLGAIAYMFSSLKNKKLTLLRGGGVILVGFIIFLMVKYISATTPQPLAALREKVHIFEYGLLSLLFYYSFRSKIKGKFIYFWAVIYGGSVGIIDEFFQHLIANRVGEFRDVMINLGSILAGTILVFSLNYSSDERTSAQGSLKRFFQGLGIFIVLLSFFIWKVHLGYYIYDPEIGQFKSKYSISRLKLLSLRKEKEWQIQKQNTPERFVLPRNYYSGKFLSLEDFYLREAMIRTGGRNKFFREKEYFKAYKENSILEKYYQPFLIYFSQAWPKKQKLACLKKIKSMKNSYYQSQVLNYIYPGWVPRLLIYGALIFSSFLLFISFMLNKKLIS